MKSLKPVMRKRIYPGIDIPGGEYYTSQQVAVRTGLRHGTIRQMTYDRTVRPAARRPLFPRPDFTAGRLVLWNVATVEQWVDGCVAMETGRATSGDA